MSTLHARCLAKDVTKFNDLIELSQHPYDISYITVPIVQMKSWDPEKLK